MIVEITNLKREIYFATLLYYHQSAWCETCDKNVTCTVKKDENGLWESGLWCPECGNELLDLACENYDCEAHWCTEFPENFEDESAQVTIGSLWADSDHIVYQVTDIALLAGVGTRIVLYRVHSVPPGKQAAISAQDGQTLALPMNDFLGKEFYGKTRLYRQVAAQ